MKRSYWDILRTAKQAPQWWDEHGVPRFCVFEPSQAICYASTCCLLLIQCQACRQEFHVCVSQTRYDMLLDVEMPLAEAVKAREIKYGDPPNVGCCAVGASMSSIPVRVLEFWRRQDLLASAWERVPQLEIDVVPDWAKHEQEP